MKKTNEKSEYLNKNMTLQICRRDKGFIVIEIKNYSERRIKISKKIIAKINKLFKQIFIDNGEFTI